MLGECYKMMIDFRLMFSGTSILLEGVIIYLNMLMGMGLLVLGGALLMELHY